MHKSSLQATFKPHAPRLARLTGYVVTALALLGGCSFIPTYERPAAPVAPLYPVADGTATTALAHFVLPTLMPFEREDLRLLDTVVHPRRDVVYTPALT